MKAKNSRKGNITDRLISTTRHFYLFIYFLDALGEKSFKTQCMCFLFVNSCIHEFTISTSHSALGKNLQFQLHSPDFRVLSCTCL